jgi:hypothetical protein
VKGAYLNHNDLSGFAELGLDTCEHVLLVSVQIHIAHLPTLQHYQSESAMTASSLDTFSPVL